MPAARAGEGYGGEYGAPLEALSQPPPYSLPGYNIEREMRPADTSPEAWKVFLDLQRSTPPAEKIRRAMSLSKTVQLLSEAGLRRKFPEADNREIFLRRAR